MSKKINDWRNGKIDIDGLDIDTFVEVLDCFWTNSIELCKSCLDEYKSMFDKKKTASGKEE